MPSSMGAGEALAGAIENPSLVPSHALCAGPGPGWLCADVELVLTLHGSSARASQPSVGTFSPQRGCSLKSVLWVFCRLRGLQGLVRRREPTWAGVLCAAWKGSITHGSPPTYLLALSGIRTGSLFAFLHFPPFPHFCQHLPRWFSGADFYSRYGGLEGGELTNSVPCSRSSDLPLAARMLISLGFVLFFGEDQFFSDLFFTFGGKESPCRSQILCLYRKVAPDDGEAPPTPTRPSCPGRASFLPTKAFASRVDATLLSLEDP